MAVSQPLHKKKWSVVADPNVWWCVGCLCEKWMGMQVISILKRCTVAYVGILRKLIVLYKLFECLWCDCTVMISTNIYWKEKM